MAPSFEKQRPVSPSVVFDPFPFRRIKQGRSFEVFFPWSRYFRRFPGVVDNLARLPPFSSFQPAKKLVPFSRGRGGAEALHCPPSKALAREALSIGLIGRHSSLLSSQHVRKFSGVLFSFHREL